ncbi:hypothetical protein ACFWFI_09450 [Streptomyces sp. NPDC060209]|uniref:hypothetical protein n=1 Tax=Streptomyces sp. NPDC060209 TaxID=3347073 RepID=UPI00364DD5FC
MPQDLQFAPYMQSSIGAAVANTMPHLLPELKPQLALAGPDGQPVPMDPPDTGLRMLGPEGVIGIDPGHIVRVDPAPGSSDTEPNYLASVEFDVPELPWLFTPARADLGRLRPWLVLAVIERDGHPVQPGTPLPFVDVDSAVLPDLAASWAWAHVQRPAGQPGPLLSRLLCPRMLGEGADKKGIDYLACLVPAFEGGRVAGLSSGHAVVDQLGDAWQIGRGVVRLPVYYHWGFRTGAAGDFEQLATAVVPLKAGEIAGLGGRTVDITEPWRTGAPLQSGDPPEVRQTITVQGVLTLHDPPEGTATEAALADFRQRVAQHISRGTVEDVGPPFYGGDHLVRHTIEPAETGWPADLNLNPERRIAAALGVDWVRENQEFLMAKAWEQVGTVREANRLRRRTAFCTEIAASVHRREVATLSPAELIRLAAPVHDRVRTGDGLPLGTEIAVSPAPTELAAPALHRLLRSRGPVARRTGVDPGTYVERTLKGELVPPLPTPVVTGPQSTGQLPGEATDALVAGVGAALRADDAQHAGELLRVLSAVATSAEANGFTSQAQALTSAVSAPVRRLLGEQPAAPDGGGTPSPEAMTASRLMAVERAFTAANVGPLVPELAAQFTAMAAGLAMSLPVHHQVLAQDTMTDDPGSHLLELGVPVDPAGVCARLASAFEPGPLLAARLASMASAAPGFLGAETPSPTDPIMASPAFTAPMALALKDSAPDWFLPGSAAIPENRAVLLKANAPFIAAFMVGVNNEMNREMRWREYPTDLRGSPFSLFWPRTDGLSDVPPIHTWPADGELGAQLTGGAGGLDVLVIRGPLVRRYPNMTVAAIPPAARQQSDLGESTWQRPTMVLKLDEQTCGYAFELPEADIHDWWFVLAENAYRIRFGFDTPETASAQADEPMEEEQPKPPWSDLSWATVGDGRGFADVEGRVVAPDGTPGPVIPGRWNAAEVANMALQRPFRVVRSARSLIGEP